MTREITVSVIKADIGGFVGHGQVHPEVVARVRAHLEEEGPRRGLIDLHVTSVGDDIVCVVTHRRGPDDAAVHGLAWEAFLAGTEVARRLKLYGAGQDLLSDSFSGNVRGLGPGVAEMTFVERPSEPIVVLMADKTEPGAWNLPLYRIFADPFNTPGLVIDPKLHAGFRFDILDLHTDRRISLFTPEESYDALVFLGATSRYAIQAVHSRALGTVAAACSTQRLSRIAGRYVGKDDPVALLRCQNGLPAVGEVLEPFATPHLVAGWMRGSHAGPLMPVALADATPSRFDGPPRVAAIGFQLAEGRLVGPRDLFGDVAFDGARREALEMAAYLRRMGPFQPHRLPLDEMEYTTLPEVAARLAGRWSVSG
ncbi:MAG: fructose 1,6-bisphosphatase [Firmicutes bacterium]|nr:fructose 1,6-bisphosphatase [Bacillota bacterium]